jgi:hypothetical protein
MVRKIVSELKDAPTRSFKVDLLTTRCLAPPALISSLMTMNPASASSVHPPFSLSR